MSSSNDYHPETTLFFATRLGLDKVPSWFRRKQALITDLAHLFTIRQGCVYDQKQWTKELFKATRYRISKNYKISYQTIDTLLGVCCLDLSEPYYCLYRFFEDAEPKLTIYRR